MSLQGLGFAEKFSRLLAEAGISTYDLARRIQDGPHNIDGASRDSLDAYRHGERLPRPPVWKAIRAVLSQQVSDEHRELLEELSQAYTRDWAQRSQKRQPNLQERTVRRRRLLGIGSLIIIAGLALGLAWVSLIRKGGTLLSERHGVLSWKKPEEAQGGVLRKLPALRLDMPAHLDTIDKADPGELKKTYEWAIPVPEGKRGVALRIGIACASGPLELLLYRNGVFFDGRCGQDEYIDFTDDNAFWWIRVRNWGPADVRYVPYVVERRRG